MHRMLVNRVEQAFARNGPLSAARPGFIPRADQVRMALAVADVLEQGGSLVVEAGTGIGKTYAYLVPALLSGRQVVVSTATKTLQDQLFARDLPELIAALDLRPVRTALLKGRSSYLCRQRLTTALQGGLSMDQASSGALLRVQQWALVTRTGDMAELPGLDDNAPLLGVVTSSRDNCLGSECPEWKNCHVNAARRDAMAADVVIINHHLFFADLAIRESGVAELLPAAGVIIFDEAHQMNETGVQFLGKRLRSTALMELGRDLVAEGWAHARGWANWPSLSESLGRAVRQWREMTGDPNPGVGGKIGWVGTCPDGLDAARWTRALAAIAVALEACLQSLCNVEDAAPALKRMAERCRSSIALLTEFQEPGHPESVRWIETGSRAALVEAPLDIAPILSHQLGVPAQDPEEHRAWIFTSATLGDDDRLSWFRESSGLTEARTLKVGSPFDYSRQAVLYVPLKLPRPSLPNHPIEVARLVYRYAKLLGGRTLVLTTSVRALRLIHEELRQQSDPMEGLSILVQGHGNKRELLQQFRAATERSENGCILVATGSFWEGVDIPGPALQLVVIDKLPFPSPGDPLVEARSRRLDLQGRNPFLEYYLPEAAIALKQGAGRLIRCESDRGALVVCDSRLADTGYGRRLQKALPPMRRVSQEQDLLVYLTELTKSATMD
ncbi:MAG: ATP-dependent DNA helicase [Rhodoferax sp.]|nr:ATP-dependent DNA helicase [Rhodoferax sp.]